MKKTSKSVLALVVASLFIASFAFAAADKPAVESKQAPCCAKAAKADKKCDHECCVAAAKNKMNCEKCEGSGPTAAKEKKA